jgi:hypothetical protein
MVKKITICLQKTVQKIIVFEPDFLTYILTPTEWPPAVSWKKYVELREKKIVICELWTKNPVFSGSKPFYRHKILNLEITQNKFLRPQIDIKVFRRKLGPDFQTLSIGGSRLNLSFYFYFFDQIFIFSIFHDQMITHAKFQLPSTPSIVCRAIFLKIQKWCFL